MKFPALARSTVLSQPLRWSDARLYLFSALFAAGNLLVPLALHSVPEAGAVFLPLFFFTLVAGWQFGWLAGLVVAVASPVLNHLLVGMPAAAMLPVVLTKSLVIGLAAALFSRMTKTVSLGGLVLVVLAMQAAGFLAERVVGMPLAASNHLFFLAVPGMLILVFGGWAVLRLLNLPRK
jgi:thiamine transporter ThiT